MVDTYVYLVEGIDLQGEVSPAIRRSAMRAVNYATSRARTASSRRIRDTFNLSARYLSQGEGRLTSTKADMSNLEGTITARRQATSLARYARGSVLSGKAQRASKGVMVKVAKAGPAKRISRGFLIRLRGAGGGLNNLGLAVRTDGSPPHGAFKPKKLTDNLYLLYGMSVDRMFDRVIGPMTPEIQDNLEQEFDRLMTLEGLYE